MESILRFRWWMLPVLFLIGCEQKEKPIDALDRGDVASVQIPMGEDYGTQVWYDLGSKQVVSTNSRFDWDLAFGCSSSENEIWLNTSVAMMAAPSGSEDFASVTSDANLSYRPDHPEGHPDSLAMAGWETHSEVWLLDLGYTADGSSRGKRKIQLSVTANGEYELRYAQLSGAEEERIIIPKDDRFNWIAFSFAQGTTVEIEPAKGTYDLCFTTYTNLFYDPYLPYLVTGVLLNPYQTTVLKNTEIPFEELSLQNTNEDEFSAKSDAIGYDWKNYNLSLGAFTVFPDFNYVVKDSEGFFYKLHFVDFYNINGIKGYPLMELQGL